MRVQSACHCMYCIAVCSTIVIRGTLRELDMGFYRTDIHTPRTEERVPVEQRHGLRCLSSLSKLL